MKSLLPALLAASLLFVSCKERSFHDESDTAGVAVGSTKATYNLFMNMQDKSGAKVPGTCFYQLDGLSKTQIQELSSVKTEDDYYKMFPLLATGSRVNRRAISVETLRFGLEHRALNAMIPAVGGGLSLAAGAVCVGGVVLVGAPFATPICMGLFLVGGTGITTAKHISEKYDAPTNTVNNDFFVVNQVSDKVQAELIQEVNLHDEGSVLCPKATDVFKSGNKLTRMEPKKETEK